MVAASGPQDSPFIRSPATPCAAAHEITFALLWAPNLRPDVRGSEWGQGGQGRVLVQGAWQFCSF